MAHLFDSYFERMNCSILLRFAFESSDTSQYGQDDKDTAASDHRTQGHPLKTTRTQRSGTHARIHTHCSGG